MMRRIAYRLDSLVGVSLNAQRKPSSSPDSFPPDVDSLEVLSRIGFDVANGCLVNGRPGERPARSYQKFIQ